MLNVNMTRLERLAKDFYNLTGIMIVLYDEKRNTIYAYPTIMCEFCTRVRMDKELAQRCLCSDKNALDICEKTKKNYIYHCHMGLVEAVSPILDNKIIIGYMAFGQIRDEENKNEIKKHIKNAAKSHEVCLEKLDAAFCEMKPVSREIINSAARMMQMCAGYLWLDGIIKVRTDSLSYHIERYILENLDKELSVKSICRHVNISKSTLYNISKKQFGMGISEYIRESRLQKASELLRDGNLTISETAERVGMYDANYFTKVFKKHRGLTPKEYKKDALSN